MTHPLSEKPWESFDIPDEIYFPRGMLNKEERRVLHYLAAEHYKGEGVIVDAGAFIGASSFALASGLVRSEFRDRTKVHSYDQFTAVQSYVADAISKDFVKVELGYDFQRIFEWQTALYRELIVSNKGDFLSLPAPKEPVEILFIDIITSPELSQRLAGSYFPKLIPGHSVVLQRDCYHAWHPYVQITMEVLSDYFEILDPHIMNSSRLYLLAKPIPKRVIEDLLHWFSFDEQTELLRKAIEKETGPMRMMFQVAQVHHFASNERPEDAIEIARSIRESKEFNPNEWYSVQLGAVEKLFHLEGQAAV